MTYSDKLKDPRWQKKRLEIMNRDGFKCRECGDTKSTLHVHHVFYIKNRDPWDYEDDNFLTLCDKCHDAEHNKIKVTEDDGFISPKEVIDVIPELNLCFSEIGNHEGEWTLKLRNGFEFTDCIDTLALLSGFCYFDMEFIIQDHYTTFGCHAETSINQGHLDHLPNYIIGRDRNPDYAKYNS